MQKLTFLLMLVSLSFVACDNDLEVAAPWKDIPVVYGFLSPTDSAHYIRIEKAFLDPNTSATEIARIPDSLYYKNLDAAIIDLARDMRFQLVEVDGAVEGYPRDEGVFAENPNILYKVQSSELQLTPERNYRLEINRSENLPTVSAQIEQVSRASIKRPVPNSDLRFPYEQDFKVLWEFAENAFFYDVSLLINFEEGMTGVPGSYEPVVVEWALGRNITDNDVETLGITFYEYLSAELEADPSISRIFTSIDCLVRSGGEELYTFRTIQLANSGITGAGGDIPQFTNLSEGLGLLTSSNLDRINALGLHPESLDSLRNGSITRDLNFL